MEICLLKWGHFKKIGNFFCKVSIDCTTSGPREFPLDLFYREYIRIIYNELNAVVVNSRLVVVDYLIYDDSWCWLS
jgi:hypothetical protein